MPAHDGLLPPTGPVAEDAILLHVGVHKTGTTALQAALADARPELLDLGVLYPGDRQAHHFAAQGVIGKQWGWRTKGGYQRGIEHFDQVAVEARAWGGRVMLSSEHFCEADDQVVGRIADGLGRDRLHVVVTLRNLGRLLPSSWQQYLKYGLRSTYDEWLVDVFDDTRTRKLSPTFWRRNEHGRIAQRWADAIGADRVTLVVLEHVVALVPVVHGPPVEATHRREWIQVRRKASAGMVTFAVGVGQQVSTTTLHVQGQAAGGQGHGEHPHGDPTPVLIHLHATDCRLRDAHSHREFTLGQATHRTSRANDRADGNSGLIRPGTLDGGVHVTVT